MRSPTRFDPADFTIGITRDLLARLDPERPDPPVPVDGFTFGVADMSENAPHNGEMHPDGDEVLYLIRGEVRVCLETDPPQEVLMKPGDGLVVPQGIWHRVDILKPARIVYVTPGPNNQFRPLT